MLVVSGVYYPVEVLPDVDAVDLEDLAGDVRAARRTATQILHGAGSRGPTSGRCS